MSLSTPHPLRNTSGDQIAERKSFNVESNPFCTRLVRPGAVSFCFFDLVDGVDSDQLSRVCVSIRSEPRSLIVGPHGTGKSTLVRTLLCQLESHFKLIRIVQLCTDVEWRAQAPMTWRAYWRKRKAELTSNHKQVQSAIREIESRHASHNGLLVIDGIEQLSWLARRELVHETQRTGISILSTSHRPQRSFATIYETSLSENVIIRLTTDQIAGSSKPIQEIVQQELHRRDLSKIRNLRDFWFELYDVVAAKSA